MEPTLTPLATPTPQTTGAGRGPMRVHVEVAGEERLVTVEPVGVDGSRFKLSWDATECVVDARRLRSGSLSVIVPAARHASHEVTCHEPAPGELVLGFGGRHVRARVSDGRRRGTARAAGAAGDHTIMSPMPGRVVRVLVESGDAVTAGQALAVVEAMKMENEVASPATGVVSEVRVAAGDPVEAGGALVVVTSEGHD
jgi:biotin carboxyl carrier protein